MPRRYYKTKKEFTGWNAVNPFLLMAGRPGFEPGLTESESVVLPLDDLPFFKGLITFFDTQKE